MHDIRGRPTYTDSKRKSFQFYSVTGARIDHRLFDATYSDGGRYERIDFKDVGSQYERRRGDFVSKTNRVNDFINAKQVYRYQGSRNVEDVGVGCVKAFPRNRAKKIYLPETDNKGVGTDLSTHFRGEQKTTGYYEHKKTSSKCVGGVIESRKEVLNATLSPIIKTKSGTTSPKTLANNTAETNVPQTNMVSSTQGNKELEKGENYKYSVIESECSKKTENNLFTQISDKTTPDLLIIQNNQAIHNKADINVNKISSVSFLQHVHNLEIASNENIGCSKENNVELEYNNNCSSKIDEQMLAERKPIPEFKSNSFLRRRFEALRRGLGKKRDLKNNSSVLLSGTASCESHKDVSIASDPPSLEAHSYSNIKVYSPIHDFSIPKYKTNQNPTLGDKEGIECRSVRNMFKLWGTKFNLDEDPSKKNRTDLEVPKYDPNGSKFVNPEKKSGKKFSFFRKKSKIKRVTDRPKKGVTAGRCEVKDGLAIKLDTKAMKPVQEITEPMPEQVLEDYVDKLRREWLQKFLFTNNDSRRSVKIRWDNKTYATSSSTIFELMDNVFKETGVVFRSQSDTTLTEESSYRTIRKPRVNFLRDVEAWMVPNTITNLKVPVHREEKEIADTKQNAHFPRNLELVLHSKDFVRINHNSSDCLKINILKDFFSDSEGRRTSSDEKVYNVVEYETTNSVFARKFIKQRCYNKGIQTDYVIDSFGKITEKPPVHRDVMLQGSEVHVAKRCDVIGVGIITQRDIGEIRNATMRIQDEFTDDYESDENLQLGEKKCEFAESYLHDYYRQWTPLGIDMFSWRVSDSHVRGSCETLSNSSVYYEDDGSKPCPNICDDFQTSVIVSSCNTSSCSRCCEPESQKPEENTTSKFFKKIKKRNKSGPLKEEMRILPKDSKEVLKSRKLYAKSNRSQWLCPDDKSYSATSKESKGAQEDSPKFKRIRYQPGTKGIEKVCEKDVSPTGSLKNKQEKNDFGGILFYRGSAACETDKKKTICPNEEKVLPESTNIAPPPCKPHDDVENILKSPRCVPSTPDDINIFPKQSLQESPSQSPSLLQQQSSQQSPRQLKRQSPQRSSCQSPQLKTTETTNYPNTPLGSAPIPKCLPKFPNMSPSTSPKSKIPIKKQTSPRQLLPQPIPPLNAPKSRNRDFPPTCSGSRVPLKTTSPNVCSKCKNSDCGKVTPKTIDIKRSSNSSCPCVVIAKKSKQILEKKDSPTKNKLKPCPTPPLTKIPIPCDKPTPPRSKIGKIFIKLKPKKKSSGLKECSAQGSKSNIIHLNSKENITIRMKPYTPSTEEIREGYDIKVKDEDGITLYERKQYKSNQPNLCALNDVFKDSNIRRVSTHSPVQNLSAAKVLDKRDLSVLNLVEIQFKLKVTQGDKITEINIGNDGDTQKETEEKRQQVKSSTRDVYALTENEKDNDKYFAEDDIPKNDINIRILIKNFKPKVENKCDIGENDHNYYRNITEKFQTVSTAYSSIELNQSPDISRVSSVHRATIDLPVDESKSKPSQAIVSDGLTDDLCTVSTFSFTKKYDDEQSFSKMKNDGIFLESIPSGTDSTAKLTEELKLKFNFGTKDSVSEIDTDEPGVTIKVDDNESLILKSTDEMSEYRNRANKKDILKMVMEEASLLKNSKNKAKIRKLKNILKSILTSDSEVDEIAVASNELIRDLTRASLRESFLSKMDSMGKVNQLLPSKESSRTDTVSSNDPIPREGCLCSTFARKLNLCRNGNEGACCCRNPQIRSETVSCDLMYEEITNANEEISIVEPEYFQAVQVKTLSELSMRKSAQLDSSKELTQESKGGLERMFVPREKLNRSNLLGVTNEDEVVVSTEVNRAQSNQTKVSKMSKFGRSFRKSQVSNYVTSPNILQSYDVKKAVLKIYAEKTVTSDGEQLVARLPKFVYDRESELKDEICEGSYKNVCKRNLVMMSVRR